MYTSTIFIMLGYQTFPHQCSAHKATRRLLNAQQYHLHAGSRPQFYHAQNPRGWHFSTATSYFGHEYSTRTLRIINATKSQEWLENSSNNERDNKKVDLVIMSREILKPASPTPHHLKTFNLSILDQSMFDVYTPGILFIPNTNKATVNEVVTKRSQHLKTTLSHILTQFYPLAGEVKENYLHIDCNDKGVYYIEARVNQTLEEFLCHPNDLKLRELNPETPRTTESSVGNYVMTIQVNIFSCGGIGLSTIMSHKIVDAQTYFLFMKAWAAASRGSMKKLSLSFVASEVFPNSPSSKFVMPSKVMTTELLSTKRFVFDSKALALLKEKLIPTTGPSTTLPSHYPTRIDAALSLIWNVAAKAASTIRPFSPQSPHICLSMMNLRRRVSPRLPNESIGNLITFALGMCYPKSQPDLSTLMGEIRESIARINSNYINSMKGVTGYKSVNEMVTSFNHVIDMIDGRDALFSSSLLKNGMYDIDFGWGKPIWFYIINPGFFSAVYMNDTLKGRGVEATLTLSPDEMAIVECDPELLSYASVDPSPLQFVNS